MPAWEHALTARGLLARRRWSRFGPVPEQEDDRNQRPKDERDQQEAVVVGDHRRLADDLEIERRQPSGIRGRPGIGLAPVAQKIVEGVDALAEQRAVDLDVAGVQADDGGGADGATGIEAQVEEGKALILNPL